MKKMLRSAVALVLSGCLMSSSVLAATTTFTDVPAKHWSYTFVTKAAEKGLVSGMGNGKFGVDNKLSNAQFVTMICNLFYKDEVEKYFNTYQPKEWWLSYMAVAYTKRLLTNTVVGENRQSTSTWSASSVNAEISRYDMAQVMVNVAQDQGWPSPSNMDLLLAQSKIADWHKVPAKYQSAVATAYAKNYLSGMDATGTFQGETSMTRAHGAVVVCKLMDSKDSVSKPPVYTNTTKLVNGSAANEKNVESAIAMLQWEFPRGYTWNLSSVYNSPGMGAGTGSQAFAYMFNDKVFGNMAASVSTADDLKPGDIVYLRNSRTYVVVEEVDDDEFTYVYCDNNGKVSWGNTSDIADLGRNDTVYTRYEGTERADDGELADGSKATESNAYDLLMDIKDDEYGNGDYWDMDDSYKSNVFGKRGVYGGQAFAYYISDQVFGELDYTSMDGDDIYDGDEIRIGDMLCLYNEDDDDDYGIVVDVDGDEITYVGVNHNGKVSWTKTYDVDDLDEDDTVYTRYPEYEDTLADGSRITESNVKSLLSDLSKTYSEGDTWTSRSQSTTLFGRCSGGEAFAGVISDKVFGELDYDEHSDSDELKPGDVVYLYDDEEYLVVTSVGPSKFSYAYVDEYGDITWKGEMRISSLESYDEIYTRY